eukprot:843231-Rhodomonas_salina.1
MQHDKLLELQQICEGAQAHPLTSSELGSWEFALSINFQALSQVESHMEVKSPDENRLLDVRIPDFNSDCTEKGEEFGYTVLMLLAEDKPAEYESEVPVTVPSCVMSGTDSPAGGIRSVG